MTPGLVSLVGAGPGDPGLLTIHAAERLRRADAVVYDALVRPETLDICAPTTRLIFAGKRRGAHALEQRHINELLVNLSLDGLRVVRLKGGDPFMFGRGAEEAEALSRAGIPWEIVPGVSSAFGAPAALGLALTRRGVSSMVTVVSGHSCPSSGEAAVDWDGVSPRSTLVVLMGLAALDKVCAALLSRGWKPSTPAAALASVGWEDEASVFSTLGRLSAEVRRARLSAPAVIVIGEVVALRRAPGGTHVERAKSATGAGR